MKNDIDAYVQKLHEQRSFGKSLKELIDIYETIPDYGIGVEIYIRLCSDCHTKVIWIRGREEV